MSPRFTYSLTFTDYRGDVVTRDVPHRAALAIILRALHAAGDPAARVRAHLITR